MVQRTSSPQPNWLAWQGFLRSSTRLTRQLDADLRRSDRLSGNDYDVLIQLGLAPRRRLRMSALAEQVLMSPSGVSRLVDELEREQTRHARASRGRRAQLRGRADARGPGSVEDRQPSPSAARARAVPRPPVRGAAGTARRHLGCRGAGHAAMKLSQRAQSAEPFHALAFGDQAAAPRGAGPPGRQARHRRARLRRAAGRARGDARGHGRPAAAVHVRARAARAARGDRRLLPRPPRRRRRPRAHRWSPRARRARCCWRSPRRPTRATR